MRPDEVLRENRRRAQRAAEEVGIAKLRPMLERAQRELEQRIAKAEGLRGAGKDSFSAVQARVVLRQVEDVLRSLKPGVRDLVVDQAVRVSGREVAGTLDYLRAAEQAYRGSVLPLALDTAALQDEVRSGARASALRRVLSDPSHKGHRGVLDRYGESVVGSFERALQQRVLQKKPWAEVRDSLVKESPFLQKAPAYWAERIVRTEAMHSSNMAAQQTIEAADDELGDMLKILSASFDGRTAADSYAVHGQVRRAREAFDDWTHSYEHPPNRPNDREVVVPHRASWPIPAALKPKSDAEVAAAWAREGRKGSPPPRPRMTTVDLAAKPQPRPAVPPPAAPPQPAPAPPPAPPPPPRGPAWSPPDLLRRPRTIERVPDGAGGLRDEVRDDSGPVGVTPEAQAILDKIQRLADAAGRVPLAQLAPGAAVDERPAYLRPLAKILRGEEKVRGAFQMKGIKVDDLSRLTFPSAEVDAQGAKGFAADAHRLLLRKAVVVRWRGALHVHDGAELLLAQKLGGAHGGDLDVDLVDLDLLDPPKAASRADLSRGMREALEAAIAGGDGKPVRDRAREVLGEAGIPTRDAKRGYKLFPAEDDARGAVQFKVAADNAALGGAAGLHEWNGAVHATRDNTRKAVDALSMDPAAFRAAPLGVRNTRAGGVSLVVHEELHGASRATAAAYQGVGVGMEEAATEILARKLTREHFEDPALLALPSRDASGSYYGGVGSYHEFIGGLLREVDVAYGSGDDVGRRVEEALLKTRRGAPGEGNGWSDPGHQIDAFVAELPKLSAAAKRRLKDRLKDPVNGPFAGP